LRKLRAGFGSPAAQMSRTLPTGLPGMSAHLVRLAALIAAVPGKRDFARQVDALQRQCLGEMTAAYGNAAFAKLIMLKVGNLLIARHGFYHRHTLLAGRPTQIMLDPSNTCQLQCPGCAHSPTSEGRLPDPNGGRRSFDWPKGMIQSGTFDRIMSEQGPFAFASILYNYGEPLLHKQFPAMVRRAKSLGLYTWTSSNLSFTFDVDAVVRSGLDLLTMSIDGTSQETLQRYRRRAKYDLCLANVRALVDAKRRAGGGPHLVWQFLTFEHNRHQISTAIGLAQEIGIDELNVSTPFDVSWDDPTVAVYRSDRARRYVFNEDHRLTLPVATAEIEVDETSLDRLLAEGLADRLDRLGIAEEPSRAGRPACDWLYQNVTFDAADRVMPCCAPPTTTTQLHFATVGSDTDGITNSDAFRRARLSIADRPAYDAEAKAAPTREPYCANCTSQPNVNFPVHPHVGMLLRCLDHGRVFDERAIRALTDWDSAAAA
jgi:pyruvate-formate lyase-activating enzyme